MEQRVIMINYKKVIIDWINQDYKDINIFDSSIDIHIDQLLNINNNDDYIREGLKLFKNLIKVIKKNKLLDIFIPVFRITLSDVKVIKDDINSLADILKNVENRPPEIYLEKRLKTRTYFYEEYCHPINNFLIQNKNYFLFCNYYKDEEDIKENWKFHRQILLKYDENNLKLKLILKDLK
ncbi:MAG: hypothetical protein Ta2D_08800 [Rickettsiales bacterium]|nr:MAG: hypothetical protein Ta2D_08800 [Rickettsiales bacterium]